ncbi:response regulator [Deminuibacter soli]|uniref:DNA-binding response regulator n=1 Tax=Deminuibacter soli TaxID=2291815 RepID=A0A3E1NEH7_9BACT|nr:response regulator transcription factor [Deminuibacter soli]RFM26380.1 DNA-binding response regulator [Deminuibacter soli]
MKIALIDDHRMLTDSVRNVLSLDPAIEEVRTFISAAVYVKNKDSFWNPDIIITDLLMPGITGIELIEAVNRGAGKAPLPKFIVLSSITDVQTIKQAIRAGAIGYLSKDTSIEELTEAIHAVHSGEQYIAAKLKNSLISNVFTEEQVVLHLSPREKDVLELMCSGNTVKEAAFKLNLSVHTVQSYHKNIMKKFKVNRTADLIVFAMQKGLYNPTLK